MNKTLHLLLIAPFVVLVLMMNSISGQQYSATNSRSEWNTGMADPAVFANAFDRYVSLLVSSGKERFLVMPLTGLRGLTSESFNAGGSLTIDLNDGLVTSQLTGLPKEAAFDLWLVNNNPSPRLSTLADLNDSYIKVGTYRTKSGMHTLSVRLGRQRFGDSLPDRAFVVRLNGHPVNGFVLTGSANIFDRMYRRQVRFVDDSYPVGFDATASAVRTNSLAKLIAQGRQLFLREDFDGNGRRCGTCHVESNNFTIDPETISTLPKNDPLFVAETNTELKTDFEKPDLMRRFGVFVENVDGFDDLRYKFTLRATQSLLALGSTITPPDPSFGIDFTTNGLNPNPPERLGWGNDGLPTRDFAVGAIVQHATKSLRRRPGVDFRVPTDEELDALAAYQLALGRQEDFNLKLLDLKSELATDGKRLFLDTGSIGEPGHKNCNACHFNAGGTTALSLNPDVPGFPLLDGSPRGFNMSTGTNTNETPLALVLGLPRDGGFGVIPIPFQAFGNIAEIPGLGSLPVEEFNSPSLVESADTGPFFHNHTVKDLESAVAFYGTAAFSDNPISIGGPGGPVPVTISSDPNDAEVIAIAGFLRVLNALDNVRSSISVATRGQHMSREEDARQLAGLALSDIGDAIESLSGGALSRSHEDSIVSARTYLLSAKKSLDVARRLTATARIDVAMEEAIRSLRFARSALSNVASLPGSYRN